MKYYYTELCFFEDIYDLPDPRSIHGQYYHVAVMPDIVLPGPLTDAVDCNVDTIIFEKVWLSDFGNIKLVWKKIKT